METLQLQNSLNPMQSQTARKQKMGMMMMRIAVLCVPCPSVCSKKIMQRKFTII